VNRGKELAHSSFIDVEFLFFLFLFFIFYFYWMLQRVPCSLLWSLLVL